MPILVDTNVIIDALLPASLFHRAARDAMLDLVEDERLVINEVIWSELAPMAGDEEELAAVCRRLLLEREEIGWKAAYLAGEAHARYRRSGGMRERTLPDFYIGAHALVAGHRLLTRDAGRYRAFFPSLEIVAPDSHP